MKPFLFYFIMFTLSAFGNSAKAQLCPCCDQTKRDLQAKADEVKQLKNDQIKAKINTAITTIANVKINVNGRISKAENELARTRDTMTWMREDSYNLQADTSSSHKQIQILANVVTTLQKQLDSTEKVIRLKETDNQTYLQQMADYKAQTEKEKADLNALIHTKNDSIALLKLRIKDTENVVASRDSLIKALGDSIAGLRNEQLDRILITGSGEPDTLIFDGLTTQFKDDKALAFYVPFRTGSAKLDFANSPTGLSTQNWQTRLPRFKRLAAHYRGRFKIHIIVVESAADTREFAKNRGKAIKAFLLEKSADLLQLFDRDISVEFDSGKNKESNAYARIYIKKRL